MRRVAGPLVAGAAAGLLGVALFAGGGSGDEPLFWIGTGVLVVAAAASAAALVGAVPAPALGPWALATVVLGTAFITWNGASVLWSVAPDRSWAYANRGFVYLGFLALGTLVAALLPRAPRLVAGGLATLLGAVLVWALAGKVAPALGPDVTLNARLREPVEYWNALGLLCVFALPLGLWLAGARTRGRVCAGALLVYAAAVALALTYSRGALAVAAVVLAVFVVAERRRLLAVWTLASAGAPAVAVAAWAFTRPALVDAGRSLDEREDDGVLFALVLLVGAAVAVAASLAAAAWIARTRGVVVRRAALAAYGAALVVAVAGVAAAGESPLDWARDFVDPAAGPVEQSPGRLTTLASNNRWAWWKQAWELFRGEPVLGTGAASFKIARRPIRESANDVALEPHNLPLQFLSETGIIGFALFAGAVASGALAVRATMRRLGGEDRAAAVALAAGALAYLLHGLVDFDWNYVAVSAPFFFVVGVLLAAGSAARRVRRPLTAAGAVLVAASAWLSIGAPWLADRRVGEAREHLITDPARASDLAEDARALNPLSVDAVTTQALADEVRGRVRAAHRHYLEAVELQPENADTWYDLGVFELKVLGDARSAYAHLNQSYTLDRWHPAGQRGSALDEARCAVDPASC